MIADNQWHPAICYKRGDGYKIVETLEEAQKDTGVSGVVEYSEVKYNWNHGQPIVDFGDYKLRIVDLDITSHK